MPEARRELHAASMLLRRGIGRVSVEAARIFAQTDSRFIRPDPNGFASHHTRGIVSISFNL